MRRRYNATRGIDSESGCSAFAHFLIAEYIGMVACRIGRRRLAASRFNVWRCCGMTCRSGAVPSSATSDSVESIEVATTTQHGWSAPANVRSRSGTGWVTKSDSLLSSRSIAENAWSTTSIESLSFVERQLFVISGGARPSWWHGRSKHSLPTNSAGLAIVAGGSLRRRATLSTRSPASSSTSRATSQFVDVIYVGTDDARVLTLARFER